MICITCDHDCHCGDSCDALPAQGGCGCRTCEHKEEEPMARKIWKWVCWPFKKIWNWLKSCLPNG